MGDKIGEVPYHEHKEITTLINVVQNLAESQADTGKDVKELVKAVSKQEVILEKLANLEINSKDGLNRIHQRVDKTEQSIADIIEDCSKEGCPALISHKNIFTEYKKIIIWFISIAIAFAGAIILVSYDMFHKIDENTKKIELLDRDLKHCDEKTNNNKNQITYLKGRIK